MKDKENTAQIKTIDTSPEVRAYVYQRINELTPYLPQNTKTGITLEEVKKEDSKQAFFQASIDLESESAIITSYGQAEDVFEAISAAAQDLQAKVSALHEIITSNHDRDLAIRQVSQGHYLH